MIIYYCITFSHDPCKLALSYEWLWIIIEWKQIQNISTFFLSALLDWQQWSRAITWPIYYGTASSWGSFDQGHLQYPDVTNNVRYKACTHLLNQIFIRFVFICFPFHCSLRVVSMDIAINDVTNQSRVASVEQCACPLEYNGLSCEVCVSFLVIRWET